MRCACMSTIPVLRSVNPHRRLRNGAKDRGNKIQRPLRLLLERWIGRRATQDAQIFVFEWLG